MLLAIGCVGGKLSWSNGTPGILTNNTITWADGETAQTGGILLGDHAIVVTPRQNTTYTVICQMGSDASAKTCTASVDVTTSSPDCPGDFQISASTTSVEKGDAVTLTATGCTGLVLWGNGLGTGNTIRIVPVVDMIVSAMCSMPNATCYADPVPITIHPSCIRGLYVDHVEFNQVGGFLGIGTQESKDVKVYYLGCEGGKVEWSKTGKTRKDDVMDTYYWLQGIQQTIEVSATCQLPGQSACLPVVLTVPKPSPDCADRAIKSVADPAVPGQVVISSTDKSLFMLTDELNKAYSKGPAKSVTVPPSFKDKVYTIMYADRCTASIRVPALAYQLKWEGYSIKDKTPVVPTNVNGDAYDFTANPAIDLTGKTYKVELSLDKVCLGTVRWGTSRAISTPVETKSLWLTDSPGYLPSPTNSNVDYATFPFPASTMVYTASCQLTNPDGTTTIYPAINSKTVIVPINNCIRIEQDAFRLDRGQQVTLKAIGCLGEVSWSVGNTVLGTASTITQTPIPPTSSGMDYVYKATCSNPSCSQLATVTVKTTCGLTIRGQNGLSLVGNAYVQKPVKIGSPVSLTGTGCEGGIIQWSTGETGTGITVQPLVTAKYSATCVVNGTRVCFTEVPVTVDNTPPDDIVCPDFSITASSCVITPCIGQLVTVTPSGCPTNSQITWGDGLVTDPDKVRDFIVNQATTLKATCTTPYNLKATAEVAISANTTTTEVSVSPMEVYKGFPTMVSAFGCYDSECKEGSYSWKKPRSSEPAQTGPSIMVNLTGPTTYNVTCNGVTKTVTINTKEIDCDFSIKPLYHSGGATTLIADQCDVDQRMSWIYLENSNGFGVPYAEDVASITVIRPLTNDNGRVDGYIVNCFKDGIPCKGVAFVRPPSDLFESGPNPFSSGDACEGLSGDETKTAQSPYYTWYLYSSWCPGRVSWYRDSDRSSLVAALLSGERYTVGQIKASVTYYYNCYLRDGSVCQGSATLKPSSGKGRLAASDPSCSPAILANNCSVGTSLATATALFYEKLFCQLSNLTRTPEGAMTVLNSVQTQLSGTGVVFPSDPTAIIDALTQGECKQPADLLAAANGETLMANPVFNEQINSKFDDIEQTVVNKLTTLTCGCSGLADLTSGDGDCKTIIAELEKIKAAHSAKQTITLTKPVRNPLIGQVSVGGQCYSDVQLAYVPDQSSIQIEPSYSQGTNSFGLGNGGNTYLTISLTHPQPGQIDSLKNYLFGRKATFPVTGAQLKQIFPNTAQSSCDEVAALLNKYSDQFGLTNAVRMSHFIGQIGAETNLSNLVEGIYSASRILAVWTNATRSYNGKTVLKYCDLFDGYDAVQTSDCPFPYCDPPLYAGTTGLQVKQKYVKSTALFDYVYACRLGNGSIDSKDGSRFRGRGFLQLTGYDNYQNELQDNWDLAYGKGNKDFMCRSAECDANLELVGTDVEIAMQTALAFWKANNINALATDVTDNTIETVSGKVNGGTNGLPERKSYTKKAYSIFNK